MSEIDPRAQLVHQESVRSLDMQSASLDEIRSRTGVLLAATSVSAAFLGASALEHHGFSTVNLLAALGFIIVILLSLWVLSPADDWEFAYNAQVLDEHYVEKDVSITNMYRSMAKGYAASTKLNGIRLKWRFRLFRFACVALGLDILLWLLGIRS